MKELPGYLPEGMTIAPLEKAPPPEQWDDWVEFDAKAWPRKVETTLRRGSDHMLQL